MIHLFYTEANKNSDTPSFVTPIEAKNEVRAAARHAELMEDLEEAGFTLGNNYLPPVLTTCADDVQLPALNEPSYEFVEKFQLVDGVWQTPEEIRFVIPTTQPVDYRYTALWVYTSSMERLTPQQDAAVKAQLLSVGGVFGLLRDATISREDVQLYNYKTLDLLIRAQEKVFISTDKPATKESIEEFTAQCCSLLSSKADPSGIDSIISTWVKKQSSQIIEEEKDKPKQKRASSKKSEYEIMEVDTALSITGVNPAESKAAQVKVAKALIDNRDSAWRAITSKFRVIPGITDVDREVRHDIVQGILKNLKIIDDSSALLHFIKTQLSDHPACPELAGYAASNEEEKQEVVTGELVNIGGGKFDVSTIFENNPPAQEPIADIEPEISLSPRALQIKAALQSVINGETDLDSAEAIATTLEGANADPAYLLEWLPNEIELAELGDELDGGTIGGLMMDLFDIAPKFITDSSERVQFFTNQIALYKKEWAEIEAQNASKEKPAVPKKPTVEELQIRIEQLEARSTKFDLLIFAAVDLISDIAGRK